MNTSSALRHDDTLVRLAAEQSRVVTRHQLATLGITSDHIRNQVAARRWALIGHSIVVLDTGPLTLAQQQWVAVLIQTPGAALAGITAAQVGGLRWWAPEDLHVVVPYGSRVVKREGVVVHVSRAYDTARDKHPKKQPPRTKFEQSIVNAAMWTPSDRRACGVLCASVQQGLTSADRLLPALDAAGPVKRRRLIRLTLGDIEGGAQSFAEIDMARLVALAGLPPFLRQTLRRDASGKIRYLDIDFGPFSVEVDGALHLLTEAYWKDQARHNELTLAGSHVLYFSTMAMRLEEAYVVDQLRRAGVYFGLLLAA